MRITPDGSVHLTYCTNIHAADGWLAVREAVERYAPPLKARFSPHAPFGIGLRLSARDAEELSGGHLEEFRDFLDREGLYVAIINGFPYGSFHRSVVKADVYAPDWRDARRVAYTERLAEILATILPAGVDGGISTVPVSYGPWMANATADDYMGIISNLARVAATLARLRRDRGVLIHLDIEPEPDCVIENTAETVSFFEQWLLPAAEWPLSKALGVKPSEAREILLDHIRLCFDCCHFSVEHERPADALQTIRAAGIKIGRIQLSSALSVAMPADPAGAQALQARLRPFADSTYLHQVILKNASKTAHFADLDQALVDGGAGDWRIHFHVPLFTSEYDGLHSTQQDVADVIAAATASPVTSHLEIETYTWDVLPDALKIDLGESIAREYDWVLSQVSKGVRS